MDERDEHLRLLAALFPKVGPDGGDADLMAFVDELPMDPSDAYLLGP